MTTTSNHDDIPVEALPDGRVRLAYDSDTDGPVTLYPEQIEQMAARIDDARKISARRAMTDGLRNLANWLDGTPAATIGRDDSPPLIGPDYVADEDIDTWAATLGLTLTRSRTAAGYEHIEAVVDLGGVQYGYRTVRRLVEQDTAVSA